MPSPFKSFTINGKEIPAYQTAAESPGSGGDIKTGKNAKISFKVNSQVKDLRISYYYHNATTGRSREVKVKNGSTIPVEKNWLDLDIQFRWKGAKYARKEYEHCRLSLVR